MKPSADDISSSLLTQYPDIYISIQNFAISDGWIFIGPNLIHLMLPFTSVPTPGKNNATSSIRDIIRNSQSYLLNKFDGTRRKKQKIKNPIDIKIACLEAKKKGLL